VDGRLLVGRRFENVDPLAGATTSVGRVDPFDIARLIARRANVAAAFGWSVVTPLVVVAAARLVAWDESDTFVVLNARRPAGVHARPRPTT